MPTSETSLKRVHQFTDKWRWPEDVERFIRDECGSGPILHVCSGQSQLGDVCIDADRTNQPDIQADMLNLPIPDATFETAVIDPPWKSVDIFDRHGLFYEICRVTQPQGKIIHNATWVPESDQCEIIGEYRRQDGAYRDASIITVLERYPGQQTL